MSPGGVLVLVPDTLEEIERDYSRYYAYIDGIPLFFHEGELGGRAEDISVDTQPTRQDVGQNPLEVRPESGDFFAQGDFSKGQDQDYFHRTGRDPAKYLFADGFDISVIGRIRHYKDVDVAAGITAPLALEQTGNALFVADGTNVKRTTDLSVFTTEDPHVGEGAVTVRDLAAQGDELFVALGVNGLHKRSSAGVYAHYKPDGTLNLDTGDTRKVRIFRSRPFVVGEAGRSVYEILADSTPDRIGDILPLGWIYEDLFAGGTFIYGCAVNKDAGLSLLRTFALKEDLTGYEWRGDTPMPRNQLVYTGRWEFGRIFLGVGKRNEDGGWDPVAYQAAQDTSGFVFLERKLSEGEGAGALDLPVRAIEPIGESILMGWSLGADAPYGSREGLAVVYPARDGAFATAHSLETTPATVEAIRDIAIFKGKTVYCTADQLFHEDTTQYRSTATFISSVGDWSSAGDKTWDLIQVVHPPLPAGASIEVYYTLKHPDQDAWILAGTNTSTGSERLSINLDVPVTGALFAIKIVSRSNDATTAAPEIISFAARSFPSPETNEWQLVRFIRILKEDRKNDDAEPHYDKDPDATKDSITEMLNRWVTYEEPGAIWKARVKKLDIVKVAEPVYIASLGESVSNVWLIQMLMQGNQSDVLASGALRIA